MVMSFYISVHLSATAADIRITVAHLNGTVIRHLVPRGVLGTTKIKSKPKE